MSEGYRLVLASASPARLQTLRRAGCEPEVIVSGVDEDDVTAPNPARLAAALAELKAAAVAARFDSGDRVVVIGCDSVLEIDGEPFGKPGSPAVARQRWRAMRGRSGVLHTGHHVIVGDPASDGGRRATATGATTVHFADLTDAEIDAYVATGEPLAVAGAFTLDGIGGAYVERIEGDPHNVVGISLPLLRMLLADLGIAWHTLWRAEVCASGAPA